MTNFTFNSVFWKLFGTMVLATAAFALISGATTYYVFQSHATYIDKQLQSSANDISMIYTTEGTPALNTFLKQLKKNKRVIAGLFTEAGDPISHVPAKLQTKIKRRNVFESHRRHWRDMHLVTVVTNNEIIHHVVFLTPPEFLAKQTPKRLVPYYIGLGIAILILVCLLLSHYFVRPIRLLQKATEDLASGQFDSRCLNPILSRKDEHGRLASDFIVMAKQIEQQIDHQKQLLRDISHDLRTPLTRQQLAVELALQKPENSESSFIAIEREIDHMQTLLEHVLSLYKLATLENLPTNTPVDLISLLESIIARNNAVQQFGSPIQYHGPDSALIHADSVWIERAIDNIVINALEHSPEGQPVEVSLESNERFWQLRVRDYGPGVEESLLPKLFDAFFQADSARTDNLGGHGLGLAISKRVLSLHNANIVATNAHPGLCVSIAFHKVS